MNVKKEGKQKSVLALSLSSQQREALTQALVHTNPVLPYVVVDITLYKIPCLFCRDLTDHTPPQLHLVRENLIGYILIALYVSCTQRWLDACVADKKVVPKSGSKACAVSEEET